MDGAENVTCEMMREGSNAFDCSTRRSVSGFAVAPLTITLSPLTETDTSGSSEKNSWSVCQ